MTATNFGSLTMTLRGFGLLLLQATFVVGVPRKCKPRASTSLASTTAASETLVSSTLVSSVTLSSSTQISPSLGTSSTTSLVSSAIESSAVSDATTSSGPSTSATEIEPSTEASSATPPPTDEPSTSLPTDEVSLLLTGVTATATTSAPACYATLSPTDSLEDVNLGGLSAELEGYSMLITQEGEPVYFRLVLDGIEYLVDIRDPEKLVIIDPDGNTLVLDDTGLLFGDEGCATQVHISVPDMFAQLAGLADENKRKRDAGALIPRAPQQQFSVRGLVMDQCSEGLDDAHLTLGSSTCAMTFLDEHGYHEWTCDWPGTDHPLSRCIESVNLFSNRLSVTLSSLSLLAKGGLSAVVIRRMVAQALLAATISSGGLLTPVVVGLVGAIAALETINELITVVNAEDPNRLAKFLCDIAAPFLGGFLMDLRLTADKAPGQVRTLATDLSEPPLALEPGLHIFDVANSFCLGCEYAWCARWMEMGSACLTAGCGCFEESWTQWTDTGKYCYHHFGRISKQDCDVHADCPGDEVCLDMYITPDLQHTRKVCSGPTCGWCPGSRYQL
ncbi:hypothetical protein VTJ49DRAFT_7277 [Mycothermus thermophilus]|uniref:Uncharacterized protein n=1 Tax=Humicola insolens TaxID=85995 RepID=A0ABR3VHD8_HUMIN